MVRDILVLTFVSGGGGGFIGWHLKTSIMSELYSLLTEVRSCVLHFLDRSLDINCWVKEVMCFVEHKHHTYHPLPPWEMLVA